MQIIRTIAQLEALYGAPVPAAITKVAPHLTPLYQQWIGASRFVILSSVGPNGTDGSPRGDRDPVVHLVDRQTIWLPDWMGNNRIDSLRNIVQDGRVSLLFMVPGSLNVVRVNGRAELRADAEATRQFEKDGKQPKTVIVITVQEVYFQCAKALMRSDLWNASNERPRVPTAGAFIKEQRGEFDADSYDAGYEAYAADRMW